MRARAWLGPALVLLAAGLCYANTFGVPFLLDDPQPGDPLDTQTRPLVWTSFALNRAWSGGSTWSYHLVNLLLHGASALLLLALLRRTIPRAAPRLSPDSAAHFALAGALVFACHPLQTAAVTYLSQRAEVLGSLWLLACLYSFVRAAEGGRRRLWQALALAALVGGFATKEIAVVAPALVLLYDATFLAPGFGAALRARRGFYALLGAVHLAAFALFTAPLLFQSELSVGFHLPEFTPLEYARTQPGVVLHYLRLFLLPHPLVFDYEWPMARDLAQWLPQSLVLAGLLALTVGLVARRSWIGFALAWGFVILAPTSSFVPIRDAAFEHRVYLSLASWSLLLLAAGRWAVSRLGLRARWLPALALGWVLALAAMTVRRNHEYRSVRALWQTVVERAPTNERGYFYLAGGLLEEERTEEAVAALEQALRLDPAYHQALNRLANVHLRRGEFRRAVPLLERAISTREDPVYRHGLGNALFGAGELARAEVEYRRALVEAPDKAVYHQSLANLLARGARRGEAVEAYRQALRLDPALESSHANLGVVLDALGQHAAALVHHQEALAILPATAEEQFNLARCLVALGRKDEAVRALEEASRSTVPDELRHRIQDELARLQTH